MIFPSKFTNIQYYALFVSLVYTLYGMYTYTHLNYVNKDKNHEYNPILLHTFILVCISDSTQLTPNVNFSDFKCMYVLQDIGEYVNMITV